MSLSAPTIQTVRATIVTAPGSALAGADYDAATPTVTIAPGTTSATVAIPVLGDVMDENDETFSVSLINAVGATFNGLPATVTIVDDGRGGADPGRGSGLQGLVDRIGAIGGTLTIDSPPGGGTVLRARIPAQAR